MRDWTGILPVAVLVTVEAHGECFLTLHVALLLPILLETPRVSYADSMFLCSVYKYSLWRFLNPLDPKSFLKLRQTNWWIRVKVILNLVSCFLIPGWTSLLINSFTKMISLPFQLRNWMCSQGPCVLSELYCKTCRNCQ